MWRMARSSSWWAHGRSQQWHIFRACRAPWILTAGAVDASLPNSSDTAAASGETKTRWKQSAGSGETARSILDRRPVEGHHGPLLEPDGTWCDFPRVASGSYSMGGLSDEETTTLLFPSQRYIQFLSVWLEIVMIFFSLWYFLFILNLFWEKRHSSLSDSLSLKCILAFQSHLNGTLVIENRPFGNSFQGEDISVFTSRRAEINLWKRWCRVDVLSGRWKMSSDFINPPDWSRFHWEEEEVLCETSTSSSLFITVIRIVASKTADHWQNSLGRNKNHPVKTQNVFIYK